MSNFFPQLEDATDEQLRHMINELDFRVVTLASDELTRRMLFKLINTIVSLDEKNEKLQKKIFALTVVGIILAAFQMIQILGIIIEWLKVYIF